MDTASETVQGQFGDRGYSTEAIYRGSEEERDFRDDLTQEAGTGGEK